MNYIEKKTVESLSSRGITHPDYPFESEYTIMKFEIKDPLDPDVILKTVEMTKKEFNALDYKTKNELKPFHTIEIFNEEEWNQAKANFNVLSDQYHAEYDATFDRILAEEGFTEKQYNNYHKIIDTVSDYIDLDDYGDELRNDILDLTKVLEC